MCAICFGPRAVSEVTGELQLSERTVGSESSELWVRAISNDPNFDPTIPLGDTPRRSWNTDPNTSYGAGNTELIAQTYNGTLGRYEFTGQQNIDAVLIGSRWTLTNLTFSFPTDGAFYADEGYPVASEPDEHVVFNAAQQDAVRYALDLVSQYTNLTFTEVTESASTHGNLRFSQTDFDDVGSAYANFPSSSEQSGDVWFGRTNQPFYLTPQIGNWGMATQLHEIGHALGLKHGHDNYTSLDLDGYLDDPEGGGPRYGSVALPSDQDGQAWSLMTYRSNPGAAVSFQGDEFNQPQTYMQNDIAALQHLYGANFNTQSGNTVYTWNETTGTMSINGVAQDAPTSNKILMTLWDGNGVDTYDLSNYSGGVVVDLNPGAFSTFSTAQLVNHRPLSGSPSTATAPGNVANALLYQGDTRSLIENAIGGIGADQILGNQASNTLTGGAGDDMLIGSDGGDVLNGGSGNDTLYGDSRPGDFGPIGFGDGLVVKGSGAGNDTYQTAIDVSNEFSLADNPNILNSTLAPHVTVQGTGDGTRDYYQLTVAAGSVLMFDIDFTTGGMDSYLRLLDSNGNVLAFDDDSTTSEGGSGSTSGLDSFLQYTAVAAGTYIIEVGEYPNSPPPSPVTNGATYELQISTTGIPSLGSGTGNDTLNGGSGDDNLFGGGGDDILLGASGADSLNGAGGNDVLQGGTDNDTLNGGAGDDSLNGGEGADSFLGGSGIDTVTYQGGTVAITVNLLTGAASGGWAAGDTFAGVENLFGTNKGDTLTGDGADNLLNGAAGDDFLDGGSGNDVLNGVSGIDIISGGAGDDTINGGTEADTLNGGVGTDLLNGGADNDILNGGGDNDTLLGGSGNDTLNGGSGVDLLTGGSGNDTITSGSGNDLLTFSAGWGQDIVTDFAAGLGLGDIIQFSSGQFADFNALKAATANDGQGNCIITFGSNTIKLMGVIKGDLDADDFIFQASAPEEPAGKDSEPLTLPAVTDSPDIFDPLVLPVGLESKTVVGDLPIICPPGDETLPVTRPELDLIELGLSSFGGRDPHRFMAEPRGLDWII